MNVKLRANSDVVKMVLGPKQFVCSKFGFVIYSFLGNSPASEF